jgi:hypothetical protein
VVLSMEMMVSVIVDNVYQEEMVLVELVQLHRSMILIDIVADDDIH